MSILELSVIGLMALAVVVYVASYIVNGSKLDENDDNNGDC